MTCNQANEHLPDYLIGSLNAAAQKELQTHLETCAACQAEAESLRALWADLKTLPAEHPSAELRPRFYAMLEAYQHGLQEAKPASGVRDAIDGWLARWWPRRPAWQFGFAMAMLLFGLWLGQRQANVADDSLQLAQLRTELQSMRQLVTLSLLQQSSPTERLRGVSYSQLVQEPDEEVQSALLHTLNYDPNVNVRLAAVDALYSFGNQAGMRHELVESLRRQTSPLVQIALIDLLVKMREKQSLDTFRQLLQDEQLNHEVKQRVEWGIQQLL